MIAIKNRFTGNTIIESEATAISEVVLEAIRNSVSLRVANLRGADLRGADLRGANLGGADLIGANLGGADLRGANDSELAIAMTRILPAGTLLGWKKCLRGVIVKLEIPAEAARSHAFGRKCRAEFVRVLEVIGAEFGTSYRDHKFVYRVGETVHARSWETDWKQECAGGVHFFITREEAEAYTF